MCRIGDVCCLPTSAHQPFLFNSAPEETCSRKVRASGTNILGMKVILRIRMRNCNDT